MLITKGFDYNFKEFIKLIQKDLKKTVKKIISTVSNSRYVEVYRRVCDILRIKDSVEVAILIMELPFLHQGCRKAESVSRAQPSKNNNHYNRRLRRRLGALAYNIFINNYRRKKDESKEFINILKNASSKGEALLRIQLTILRIYERYEWPVSLSPYFIF